jgi:hypothetical protein
LLSGLVKSRLWDFGLSRLGNVWPTIDDIIQLSPFAVPAQLAQSVVGNTHSIIFGQAKASARQPYASERERNGVAQQFALGEAHTACENIS